jgi:hypothetical protein
VKTVRSPLTAAVVPLLLAAPALAGEIRGSAQAPPSAPATAETPPERPPTGWLSDPKEAPDGVLDALVSGKIHLDNRFRVEWADTTGKLSSTAVTNRIRLGYETKAFHGFSGLVEMENVATPDEDSYSVPPAGSGDPDRTTIADPPGTEVNQAFVRYLSPQFGGSLVLDLKGGRQRILLDDQRFVGAVGWRQFEQTFDSAHVALRDGEGRLRAMYAYVDRVNRIFGPDGPNPDVRSHFANVSYEVVPEFRATPFAYLLDFLDADPFNSVDSYGLRLTGVVGRDTTDPRDVSFDYELTWARQQDAGRNPVDFVADFFAVQARVRKTRLGSLTAGYQILGSDEGAFGFRFPLGTNHKFQGFADEFLVTPAEGLRDLYFGLGGDLPWGIWAQVIYHRFETDFENVDLGWEIDFVARKSITREWSFLVKAAYYEGRNGQSQTTKLWAQTDFRF